MTEEQFKRAKELEKQINNISELFTAIHPENGKEYDNVRGEYIKAKQDFYKVKVYSQAKNKNANVLELPFNGGKLDTMARLFQGCSKAFQKEIGNLTEAYRDDLVRAIEKEYTRNMDEFESI